MIQLSIIIVNYNVKELLEQSLVSIRKAAKGISTEIFVVDNASTDGSVELIRTSFPEVHLIANRNNVGFAAANNQAMKEAKGNYLLLLNPDTVVQEDTFSVILRFMEGKSDCGMVGCKILNPDGTLQLACRRSFPTPWVGLTRIVGLSRLFPRSRLFGKYNLTYLDPDQTYEVEAISGSFMFVRREVLEDVGYLDEAFFMYGEDLDWCYRIREAGWKIFYLPETKIIHFKGESSKRADIDLTLMFYRAMELFVQKHYHSRYFYLPQWFLMSGILLRAAMTFLAQFIRIILPVIVDLLLLNISLVIANLIRFGALKHLHSYLTVTVVYSSIWLLSIGIMGGYGSKKYSALRSSGGVIIGFIMNASLTFFFNQYAFSRAVVLISGCLNIIFIGGWRFIFKLFPRLGIIQSRGTFGKTVLGRRTLVVGTREGGQKVIEKLRSHVDGGYMISGLVTIEESDMANDVNGIRLLGTTDKLDEVIRHEKIQEVIFSTDHISYDKILEIMSRTRRKGTNFKLVPRNMEVIIGKASIDRIGALPLVDIDYQFDRPLSIVSKRSIDILLSLMGLLLLSPFYLYTRFIKNVKLITKNIVTYHGNFIRVSEFDQSDYHLKSWIRKIPYLWSIFKGDLSIVGSEMIEYTDETKDEKRIAMKPGLFGLVQLNKDSAMNSEDKQRYDLFYLKNYSPVLDLEIILKSIFNI
ncbi:glycosyltransferase [candidate division KSB1 bacterium]|nr:glycosyltransferase [candidate division KSB1 bacterium]